MAYWPETGDLSQTTLLEYALITLHFDETKPPQEISVKGTYENIGILRVSGPVDFVAGHLAEFYKVGWQAMVAEGHAGPDRNIKCVSAVKLRNAGQVKAAADMLQGCMKRL